MIRTETEKRDVLVLYIDDHLIDLEREKYVEYHVYERANLAASNHQLIFRELFKPGKSFWMVHEDAYEVLEFLERNKIEVKKYVWREGE